MLFVPSRSLLPLVFPATTELRLPVLRPAAPAIFDFNPWLCRPLGKLSQRRYLSLRFSLSAGKAPFDFRSVP